MTNAEHAAYLAGREDERAVMRAAVQSIIDWLEAENAARWSEYRRTGDRYHEGASDICFHVIEELERRHGAA